MTEFIFLNNISREAAQKSEEIVQFCERKPLLSDYFTENESILDTNIFWKSNFLAK